MTGDANLMNASAAAEGELGLAVLRLPERFQAAQLAMNADYSTFAEDLEKSAVKPSVSKTAPEAVVSSKKCPWIVVGVERPRIIWGRGVRSAGKVRPPL